MKPQPDSIVAALRSLHTQSSRTVLIGDSVTDVQAAQAAGIACIGYAKRLSGVKKLRKAGATATLNTITQMADATRDRPGTTTPFTPRLNPGWPGCLSESSQIDTTAETPTAESASTQSRARLRRAAAPVRVLAALDVHRNGQKDSRRFAFADHPRSHIELRRLTHVEKELNWRGRPQCLPHPPHRKGAGLPATELESTSLGCS